MRCLQLSPQELNAVTKTLSRAEILDLTIDEWTRRGSYAENNDRSRQELMGLSDISRAYFSSPSMKELRLSLGNYPSFHEIPKVSLDDFLVLPLSKSHLSVINFRNLPMKLGEMQTLVDSVKITAVFLSVESMYILDSNWLEGIEVLRGLENLEGLELKSPKGGAFGYRFVRTWPTVMMKEYVLRQTAKNPLIDWNGEDGMIVGSRAP